MKGFHRENLRFSLCGLNCGLCPMHLNRNCPGCGGGEGNQSCAIAACSLQHGAVAFCFQCTEFPCEKYAHIDDFDSFITHRNQKADLEKAKRIGIDAYCAEQAEKSELLNFLLSNYNDGRRKNLFCIAVNLLDTAEIKRILRQLSAHTELNSAALKEKAAYAAALFQDAANQHGMEWKLRKKASRP
nr:DUF3795 domain-containing protein [uncultured Dysosmobacter sp.]